MNCVFGLYSGLYLNLKLLIIMFKFMYSRVMVCIIIIGVIKYIGSINCYFISINRFKVY